MLESIKNIYETIFEELKTYLQDNSLYNPYVYKKEPNNKLFPVVVVKELFNESNYTTLKYTDEIYYIDLEINIYAIQNNNVSNMTICNELTYLIEKFFKENYKVKVRISKDVPNLDTLVYRNLVNINFKVETKYKDKLIISPK